MPTALVLEVLSLCEIHRIGILAYLCGRCPDLVREALTDLLTEPPEAP